MKSEVIGNAFPPPPPQHLICAFLILKYITSFVFSTVSFFQYLFGSEMFDSKVCLKLCRLVCRVYMKPFWAQCGISQDEIFTMWTQDEIFSLMAKLSMNIQTYGKQYFWTMGGNLQHSY